MSAIVRLPHPRSGDSQGQETFLAPSADKQTRNYDTRVYINNSMKIKYTQSLSLMKKDYHFVLLISRCLDIKYEVHVLLRTASIVDFVT